MGIHDLMPGKPYKEHKFENMIEARQKQASMKRLYGYTPEIFKVWYKGKTEKPTWVVIEPHNLRRI